MTAKPQEKNPRADLDQVVNSVREANNVLVTINSSPTVDQLASCIGLTLVLNKLGKHATAVFSGEVPSTLEFLKPQETLEKNTDSLRDFIIALDKSKADKLRYKVEDDVVKIFITPYKTSIDEDDLQFSQGDFNVDVVVALGVEEKKQLDKAILSHGRILHDATVISVNTQSGSRLGSINWSSEESSSLCEMVADIVQGLSNDVLDPQNATALLTGIVAETERYSNEKARPHTMSVAGTLMSAGASTQLVSNELDSVLKSQQLPPLPGEEDASDGLPASNDGILDIDHSQDDKAPEENKTEEEPERQSSDKKLDQPQAGVESEVPGEKPKDEYLDSLNLSEDPHKDSPDDSIDSEDTDRNKDGQPPKMSGGRMVKEPPHFTGQLTANTVSEDKQYTGSTDPLTNLPESQILGKQDQSTEGNKPGNTSTSSLQQKVDQTLREIEESVGSPHLEQEQEPDTSQTDSKTSSTEEARKAAEIAAAGESERPKPRKDTGTSPLGDDISHDDNSSSSPPPPTPPPITPLT